MKQKKSNDPLTYGFFEGVSEANERRTPLRGDHTKGLVNAPLGLNTLAINGTLVAASGAGLAFIKGLFT
jgi:hypothetical protein